MHRTRLWLLCVVTTGSAIACDSDLAADDGFHYDEPVLWHTTPTETLVMDLRKQGHIYVLDGGLGAYNRAAVQVVTPNGTTSLDTFLNHFMAAGYFVMARDTDDPVAFGTARLDDLHDALQVTPAGPCGQTSSCGTASPTTLLGACYRPKLCLGPPGPQQKTGGSSGGGSYGASRYVESDDGSSSRIDEQPQGAPGPPPAPPFPPPPPTDALDLALGHREHSPDQSSARRRRTYKHALTPKIPTGIPVPALAD